MFVSLSNSCLSEYKGDQHLIKIDQSNCFCQNCIFLKFGRTENIADLFLKLYQDNKIETLPNDDF